MTRERRNMQMRLLMRKVRERKVHARIAKAKTKREANAIWQAYLIMSRAKRRAVAILAARW